MRVALPEAKPEAKPVFLCAWLDSPGLPEAGDPDALSRQHEGRQRPNLERLVLIVITLISTAVPAPSLLLAPTHGYFARLPRKNTESAFPKYC